MVSCFPKHLMISVSLRLCSLEMYPWNSLRSCCLGEPVGCFAFALIRYQSIYPICYVFNAYFSLYFSQCPNRVILSHKHVSDLAFIINIFVTISYMYKIYCDHIQSLLLPSSHSYLSIPPPQMIPFPLPCLLLGSGKDLCIAIFVVQRDNFYFFL